MQAIFRPAIRFINRLRFTQKFALIGLVVFIALAELANNLYWALDNQISVTRNELDGTKALGPTLRLLQTLQIHRGVSRSLLSGNASMADRRIVAEQNVTNALDQLNSVLPPVISAGDSFATIRNDWDKLRKEGMGLGSTDNFLMHSSLIVSVRELMVDTADATSLTLDPEIDSYYLIDTVLNRMPSILEVLGQLRAKGTPPLDRRDIYDQEKTELNALLTQLFAEIATLNSNQARMTRFSARSKEHFGTAAADLAQTTEKIKNVVVDEMMLGRFEISSTEYFDMITFAIDGGYKEIQEVMLPALDNLLQQRKEKLEQKLLASIGSACAMVLLIGYFSMATYIAMVGSIKKLSATAHTLATGDLRSKIDLGTRDELKEVGDSFNEMAEAIRVLLNNVQVSAGKVWEASSKMAGSAGEVMKSSMTQSESASAMAAAVEEMTVGIEHIGKNAAEANLVAQSAGMLSTEGSLTVGTVVREIGLLADAVNESATIVDDLGEQSGRISAIIDVIKEIADQTNLLALNAAIEAARAGESGRGFAVVADEVRKLAERTTKSTVEISTMITSIQNGAERAVGAMQYGVSRVGAGVELAERAGTSMTAIQSSADQVVQSFGDISAALNEQAAANVEISRNVERISRMAEENNSAVAGNMVTAQELEQLAEALRMEVRRFTVA